MQVAGNYINDGLHLFCQLFISKTNILKTFGRKHVGIEACGGVLKDRSLMLLIYIQNTLMNQARRYPLLVTEYKDFFLDFLL